MNPESLLRAILQAEETCSAAILEAERKRSATLRQLIDKMMVPKVAEVVTPKIAGLTLPEPEVAI